MSGNSSNNSSSSGTNPPSLSISNSGSDNGGNTNTSGGRKILQENGPIIMSPGGTFRRFTSKYSELGEVVPQFAAMSLPSSGEGGANNASNSDGSDTGVFEISDKDRLQHSTYAINKGSEGDAKESKDSTSLSASFSVGNAVTPAESNEPLPSTLQAAIPLKNGNGNSIEGGGGGVNIRSDYRDLFGGAIKLVLDERFEDISIVREVPEHQEVFVDKYSETSIIIELLEYKDDVKTETAAKFFFDDLSSCNGAFSSTILSQMIYTNGEICMQIPAKFDRIALIGKQSVAKFNLDESQSDEIFLCMLVLRLDAVGTDMMITMNIPAPADKTVSSRLEHTTVDYFSQGKASSSSSSSAASSYQANSIDVHPMLQHFKTAINSLDIVDWALFA